MLSAVLTEALTTLHNHELGILKAEPAAREAAWRTVAEALAASHAARAAMQRKALERAEARGSKATGRPPSQTYVVAMGTLWERRALGIADAHEIVAEALKEHKAGRAPSKQTLAVHLSRKGQWWRHVATDDGEHDLTVTKLA